MSDKQKMRFGIFPKLLIAMAIVAVLPLALTWYINLQKNNERIWQNSSRHLATVSKGLGMYIDTWVEMNVRMLNHDAELPQIQSMDPKQQSGVLRQIVKDYDWNYLAFTVNTHGDNIGRSDDKAPKYYGDRNYVKQVLNGAQLGQQVLIGKSSGKPALVLSVPIKRSGDTIGILAIAMTINDISKQIIQTKIGKTGYLFLVDEKGKIIAHPSSEFTSARKDLSDNPAVLAYQESGQNKTIVYADEHGKKMIAAVAGTRYGWTLVAEQPYNEAFADIKTENRNSMILLGITLAITVLIALLISSGLSIPIRRLTNSAEDISRGQLGSKVGYTDRGDEIGSLARAIDRLSTSLRIAMKRMAKPKKAPVPQSDG